MIDYGKTDLDSDCEIRKTISLAESGNESAAWMLIHQIETALTERRVSAPLFDHAAVFFGALLDLHEQRKESPKDLSDSFAKLFIVRGRGRRPRDDEENLKLAARVVLVHQSGYSVDAALGAMEDQQILSDEPKYSRSAYKESYYNRCEKTGETAGKRLERIAFDDVIESLAGMKKAELVGKLIQDGRLENK